VRDIFPAETFRLFRERSFAVFALASFLICIPLQFYYAFTNLFLNEIGIRNAAGKMTGGQMSELFGMLLIPWFFRRLGVKYMLVAGMLAWTLRYAFFAFCNGVIGMWMLCAVILLHGICYDFFFVTGQIYVDQKSPIALRAAAQGMITLITYGAGMLLGSWLSGRVVDMYAMATATGVSHAWRSIWLISAACSAAVLLLFLVSFSNREDPKAPIPTEM
jgi:MFS family permease